MGMTNPEIQDHPEQTAYTIAPISVGVRITKAGAPLAIGILVSFGLWNSGHDLIGLSFLIVTVWVAWQLFSETESRNLTRVDGHLTPAAQGVIERERLEEEQLKQARLVRQEEFWTRIESLLKHWWARYPLAGLITWYSIVMIQQPKGDAWIPGVVALMFAAYLAREISILIVGAIVAYLLFAGAAMLPVSVAVIIGALIIASAMRR